MAALEFTGSLRNTRSYPALAASRKYIRIHGTVRHGKRGLRFSPKIFSRTWPDSVRSANPSARRSPSEADESR